MGLKTYHAENILAWRKDVLSRGGRKVDLDWLLDIVGGLCWSDLQNLYLNPNHLVSLRISLEELEIIWKLHISEQRPLQHLIGKCYWRDFVLEVSSDVLIPRQETELLVDFVLQKFDNNSNGVWVDLGTGSGALAIALARALTEWEGHAIDCSSAALSLAARNFARLSPDSKVCFHLGDWWQPLSPWKGSIQIAVANPPYIPKSVFNKLHPIVRDNEPRLALFGGEDGLDSCRKLVSGSIDYLSPGGWLFFEHHHDQSKNALQMMVEAGFENVSFEKDLEGVRRFAIGSKPLKIDR